jgi:hypothetical protein
MKTVTVIVLVAAVQRRSGSIACNAVTVHKILIGDTVNVLNYI